MNELFKAELTKDLREAIVLNLFMSAELVLVGPKLSDLLGLRCLTFTLDIHIISKYKLLILSKN